MNWGPGPPTQILHYLKWGPGPPANILHYLNWGPGPPEILHYLKWGPGPPEILHYLKWGPGREKHTKMCLSVLWGNCFLVFLSVGLQSKLWLGNRVGALVSEKSQAHLFSFLHPKIQILKFFEHFWNLFSLEMCSFTSVRTSILSKLCAYKTYYKT